MLVKIIGRKDDFGICPPEGFNEVLDRVAKEFGFIVADVKDINPQYIEDNIHLSEASQLRLAEHLVKTIEKFS